METSRRGRAREVALRALGLRQPSKVMKNATSVFTHAWGRAGEAASGRQAGLRAVRIRGAESRALGVGE